jgi:hypothetical protein
VKWSAVSDDEVSKRRALVGGSVGEMMRLTGWQDKQIMYWGDHVFADLAGPSRESGWLTGAITRELAHEINIMNSPDYTGLAAEGASIEGDIKRAKNNVDFKALEVRRNANFKKKSNMFNPHFGSLFYARGEASMFGWNVRRLSDVYTSQLTNLLYYPVDHRFYPKQNGQMPHDRSKIYIHN